MTTEEFQRDGNLRARLTVILKDPTFLTAVSAVKDETEPSAGVNDMNPVKKAALYDQRAGMNKLLTRLEALTQSPAERKPLRVKELAKSVGDIPTENH